jgi:hypothetical protein
MNDTVNMSVIVTETVTRRPRLGPQIPVQVATRTIKLLVRRVTIQLVLDRIVEVDPSALP